MTSPIHRLPASSLRLGAAGLLAVTALLGTTSGTLGEPATACAAPKDKFDRDAYNKCAETYWEPFEEEGSDMTFDELKKGLEYCCDTFGGVWEDNLDTGWGECTDPADDPLNEYPAPPLGQLPQIPGPTEATQAPPPPPPPTGPIAQLPSQPPVQTR